MARVTPRLSNHAIRDHISEIVEGDRTVSVHPESTLMI
jgi:hypothetical protein